MTFCCIFQYLFLETNIDFLPDNERSHMRDVKGIFNFAALLLVFFLYLPLYEKPKEMFRKAGKGALAIEGVILLSILTIGFTKFWDIFHNLLFPQGNFSFPVDSTLIQLYPASYFIGFIVWVFIVTLILALLPYILDNFIKKKGPIKKKR